MKKIIFLTDFSVVAKNAFLYALSLADNFNSELHILHITPIIEPKTDEERYRVHPLAQMFNDSLENDEWNEFKTEAKKLEQLAHNNNKLHVPVEFHFENGYFQDVIESHIVEKSIDLIVMGTSGNNTIDKKLFGSHAVRLIDSGFDIPILAVPAKAVFTSTGAFAAAVMLVENECVIIRRIATKLSPSETPLKCVHIVDTEEKAMAAQQKKAHWLTNFEGLDVQVDIVIDTDIEDGLTKYVEDNYINILSIIHRQLPFMKRLFNINHSKRLLRLSETAMLIYNVEDK